jgi:putative nucleotidyltransferase with HDIG domain
MKKRVLFVDDQPNVLAGLRRMLHGCRHEWEMEFAEGPNEALVRLNAGTFDVVVTDMRMPGMDGAQLLGEVMKLYPETVRIVLSGQSEQETIMRSVGPAHQYLSKPCDPETLKSTVARACALRDRFADAGLVRLVSQVTNLPSLPGVYAELVRELRNPEASVQRVAELISHDVGMTAKLMQLVNSSFFGPPRRVDSPFRAATLLGLNLLKPLVLSAGIFSQYDAGRLGGYSLDVLVRHSLLTGTLAQKICQSLKCPKPFVEDAAMAGLLHDVGELVFAANHHEKFAETIAVARTGVVPRWSVEREVLGATHADIGAYLLGLWGLPDPIVEAVAFHHEPGNCVAPGFSPLSAVHVADVLVGESNEGESPGASSRLDEAYLDRAGVADRLDAWRRLAAATLAESVPT